MFKQTETRKKSASIGPIQAGRNKDFDAAKYPEQQSAGITGYRPMFRQTPLRKRSHQEGPVEIGRADYKVAKEEDYDFEISDGDFLKPKCWYIPISRFDPHEGEKAERKQGPVEIGRVPKTIWTPYTLYE